jgi:diacylglycerol kinase family enzyme
MLSKAELGAEIRRLREAVLVVNTASRHGERSFSAARAGLEKHGIRVVESYPVRTPSQLPKIVESAIRAGHRLVVVGGGDGTLSSVVGAFAYADAVLGVLPLGTGNSFAQTLTVPGRLDAALDVIANGKVVDVDLGIVNGAYFANVVTIGLSADVARRRRSAMRRSARCWLARRRRTRSKRIRSSSRMDAFSEPRRSCPTLTWTIEACRS